MTPPSPTNSWRNKNRILRGINRGKFAKKQVVLRMENAQKSLADKRLCETKNWFDKCKNVIDGRRIVDLAHLAAELWCKECNLPLSLRYATDEFRSGLASIITVKCTKCGNSYKVTTNAEVPGDAHMYYTVNLKAVMGIGETHLNTILSALNIPPLNPTVVKRHERVAGPAIESIAKDSCREGLQLEKKLTLSALQEDDK
ncbi:uncharacterized protein LOC112466368 isoform X2 [Temnothorax curvispinosus]|uniref:Uncharacterized protein LOC112466368 isoform X2 n=3 Tax=Temnothorax curvispinosus TaxID=300111 RepID=A0A6J1R6C2_9HYME|nr:uncharacterized protein LOC112466368 isoform X2 [Temnothorax curvispinosus]